MKRRLIIIALFLLLGVVVNVAVAWGCAVWSKAVLEPGYRPQFSVSVVSLTAQREAGFESTTEAILVATGFGIPRANDQAHNISLVWRSATNLPD